MHRVISKLIILLATIVIVARFFLLCIFVHSTGDIPAFEPRLGIDTGTYLHNAQEMIKENYFLYSKDAYHSAGMSIYCAALLRIFNSSVIAIKYVHVLWWCFILFFIWDTVRLTTGKLTWAFSSIAFLSLSEPLFKYCALIQYEIIVAGLYSYLYWLHVRFRLKTWVCIVSGLLGVGLSVFRVHFGLALVFLSLLLIANNSSRRAGLVMLLTFCTFSSLWILLDYSHRGSLIIFQDGYTLQLNRFLTPTASGKVFPYPQNSGGVQGLQWVLTSPDEYFDYIARKIPYLFGFRVDAWHFDSLLTYFLQEGFSISCKFGRFISALCLMISLCFSLLLPLFSLRARPLCTAPLLGAAVIAAVLTPQLFFGSSTRYLVPIFPIIFFNWFVSIALLKEVPFPRV